MVNKQQYDIHAENQILGVCIEKVTNWNQMECFIIAKSLINLPEVFYDEDNRIIWATMVELYNEAKSFEYISLTRELRKKQELSYGGESWAYIIGKKMENVNTTAHLRNWCLHIVEDFIIREKKKALQLLENADDVTTIQKDLSESITKALSMRSVDEWEDMSKIALDLTQRREKIASGVEFGVKTGFDELDKLSGGLEEGLIVIAARPSMGKTAFACSLAISMASLGSAVGFISLEMPNVQLAGRFNSIVSGVEFWRIFRNEHQSTDEAEKVQKSLLKMANLPIYTTDSSSVNLNDIRWKAERLVKTKNAKCIIIDYLQLVDSLSEKKNETREREVAKLSKGLKQLSRDLHIPIIALAQLNRESESGDKVSKVGKLSQLRESGSIEQDIDMGIIVDRPFKRGDKLDENGVSTENKAKIIIEKYRNGETKEIELEFEPKLMLFKNKVTDSYNPDPFKIKRGYDLNEF